MTMVIPEAGRQLERRLTKSDPLSNPRLLARSPRTVPIPGIRTVAEARKKVPAGCRSGRGPFDAWTATC